MRWHDGWYGSCIYTLTSQHYIIRSKLHLTGGGWTDTTRAYIHRSCRSSLLMDDRMEWGMHTSCWRHDGQDVKLQVRLGSALDIFKRVKLMFQLIFFTSQIKLASELLVRMFIFIYFTHSFQQDYHEDDVEFVSFSRTCGGSRQWIKYNFEFGCICIEDLVNLIHIVQSVCLGKWSYM
jgi:hypothetical protein